MSDGTGQTSAADPVVDRVLACAGSEGRARVGFTPLAWWLSRHEDAPADPRAVLEAKLAIVTWAIHHRALVELTRALEEREIAVAFLKGADLNLRAYPEPGLRPMVDLDLLVSEDDLPRVGAVLEGLGYACRDTSGDAPANTAFERDYHRPKDGVDVDVHTAVDWHESLGVDAADLLARRVAFGPDRIPLLAAPDLLLNLATHALRDFREASTKSVVDAHYVLTTLQPSWNDVVACARAWRQRPALRLLLERLRRFGGETIPDEVMRALDTGPVVRRLVRWLATSLDGPPAMTRDGTERLVRLGMIESNRDRLRLLWRYGKLRLAGIRASR